MSEKFSTRLARALTLRNIKPIELSVKTGLSKSSISDYLKNICVPKSQNIQKIAAALNINPLYLEGYNVPMENDMSNVFPAGDEPIKVPVVGRISAGLPILAVENIIGSEFAPSTYMKKNYTYFYLVVEGDSMNLKFNDGDLILVQQQDTLENDEIGVILIDDEATVKKYRTENGLIILEPMSTNTEHRTQIYNPKQIKIRIIGKVISYQGKI